MWLSRLRIQQCHCCGSVAAVAGVRSLARKFLLAQVRPKKKRFLVRWSTDVLILQMITSHLLMEKEWKVLSHRSSSWERSTIKLLVRRQSYLFIYFCFFRATSAAYGGSQVRGRIGAAATEGWDPSHVCDLHHSSRQRQIFNPVSEARGRTCVLTDTNQTRCSWAMRAFLKPAHMFPKTDP